MTRVDENRSERAAETAPDDGEWWGYNAANEPAIRAFVLSIFSWLLPVVGIVLAVVAFHFSTRALELAEDGLATNGGLAYAARIISLTFLWVLAAAVAAFLLIGVMAAITRS